MTSTAVAPPAPAVVVSAVARHAAAAVGPALADRVASGPAPTSWTLDTAGLDRYAQVLSVAGPTPAGRADGRTLSWTYVVQVDLYERDTVEDPDVAAALLVAFDGARTDEQGDAAGWRLDLDAAERVEAPIDAGWTRHRLDVRVTVLR